MKGGKIMYCRYCGKQLEDGTVICPGCGRLTDDGQRLVKPVAQSVAVPVQSATKKTKLTKSTITALVAFFLCLFGAVLNTIITTSSTMQQLMGESSYMLGQIGLVAVAGIFSILTLITAVVSLVLSVTERASAYNRIFPICMTAVGLAYIIDFICSAVMLSMRVV